MIEFGLTLVGLTYLGATLGAGTEPNPIIASGIAFASAVGIATLLFRIQRELVRGQGREIKRLGLENRECTLNNELHVWRQRELERILRQNNIRFPDEYWDAAPPWIIAGLTQVQQEKEELLK